MNSKWSKKFTAGIIVLLIMVCFIPALALAGAPGDQRQGKGFDMKGHHGPPPEAYTACEGKNAGDTAQFVSPRGETVTGTCEKEGDRLVLRPDHPKPRPGGEAENAQRGTQE